MPPSISFSASNSLVGRLHYDNFSPCAHGICIYISVRSDLRHALKQLKYSCLKWIGSELNRSQSHRSPNWIYYSNWSKENTFYFFLLCCCCCCLLPLNFSNSWNWKKKRKMHALRRELIECFMRLNSHLNWYNKNKKYNFMYTLQSTWNESFEVKCGPNLMCSTAQPTLCLQIAFNLQTKHHKKQRTLTWKHVYCPAMSSNSVLCSVWPFWNELWKKIGNSQCMRNAL